MCINTFVFNSEVLLSTPFDKTLLIFFFVSHCLEGKEILNDEKLSHGHNTYGVKTDEHYFLAETVTSNETASGFVFDYHTRSML